MKKVIKLTESDLVRLVNKVINEQPNGRNVSDTIENGDTLGVQSSDNKNFDIKITSVQPRYFKGYVGLIPQETAFVFGPKDNQIRKINSGFDASESLTILSITIGGKKYDVDLKGNINMKYT